MILKNKKIYLYNIGKLLYNKKAPSPELFKLFWEVKLRHSQVTLVSPESIALGSCEQFVGCCRECFFEYISVFKWIMPLCIGHGPGIKPDIDQVRLAKHGLTWIGYQHDLIYKWFVKIKIPTVDNRILNACFHSLDGIIPLLGTALVRYPRWHSKHG